MRRRTASCHGTIIDNRTVGCKVMMVAQEKTRTMGTARKVSRSLCMFDLRHEWGHPWQQKGYNKGSACAYVHWKRRDGSQWTKVKVLEAINTSAIISKE